MLKTQPSKFLIRSNHLIAGWGEAESAGSRMRSSCMPRRFQKRRERLVWLKQTDIYQFCSIVIIIMISLLSLSLLLLLLLSLVVVSNAYYSLCSLFKQTDRCQPTPITRIVKSQILEPPKLHASRPRDHGHQYAALGVTVRAQGPYSRLECCLRCRSADCV